MRPSSCAEAESLWRYLDRELAAGELASVSAHLKHCAACQSLYHEQALELNQYRMAFQETPFGDAFAERLRARLDAQVLASGAQPEPWRKPSLWSGHRYRLAAVAALLLLIPLCVLFGLWSTKSSPPSLGAFTARWTGSSARELGSAAVSVRRVGAAGAAEEDLAAGASFAGDAFLVPANVIATLTLGAPRRDREVATLELSGGAELELGEQATAAHFAAYCGAGVLKARVAHRAFGETFTIATPHALVKVVGTEFELQVGKETSLLVAEGRVSFRAKASNLLPGGGQTRYVGPDDGPIVVRDGEEAQPEGAPGAQAGSAPGPAITPPAGNAPPEEVAEPPPAATEPARGAAEADVPAGGSSGQGAKDRLDTPTPVSEPVIKDGRGAKERPASSR